MKQLVSKGVSVNKTVLQCPRCSQPMAKPNTKAQTRSCSYCDYTLRGTIEQHEFLQANAPMIEAFYLAGNNVNDTCNQFGISANAFYKLPGIRKHKGEFYSQEGVKGNKKKRLQFLPPVINPMNTIEKKLDELTKITQRIAKKILKDIEE